MIKLFENRVFTTMNKLAASIEDIKRGQFGGEDKGRDGAGGGGVGMTHDAMSVLQEQHNSLMLVLAAQTQKLDNLEQICLHPTRSDEHSGSASKALTSSPLQTVGDLKERLANAAAEVLDLQNNLKEEKSRVDDLQSKLRAAQQALDEGARERSALGNTGQTAGRSWPAEVLGESNIEKPVVLNLLQNFENNMAALSRFQAHVHGNERTEEELVQRGGGGEVQGMETTQVIEITSAPGPAAAPTRAAAAVAPSGACPLPPDPPSLPPTARQPCRQYP